MSEFSTTFANLDDERRERMKEWFDLLFADKVDFSFDELIAEMREQEKDEN